MVVASNLHSWVLEELATSRVTFAALNPRIVHAKHCHTSPLRRVCKGLFETDCAKRNAALPEDASRPRSGKS